MQLFSKHFLLLASVFCGAAACQDNAEYCNDDSRSIATSDMNLVIVQCGTYVSFWPYTPEPVQNLIDLPTEIRERVDRHLTDRFGGSYYSKLSFVRGLYVDKTELYRVNPSAKDYEWTVYSYRLLFRFSDISKGVAAYTAEMRLDESGEVIQEIELPPTRQFAEKINLISTADAYAIASGASTDSALQESKNPVSIDELRMRYAPEVESLVYQFRKVVADDGHQIDYMIIRIDAHSGEILPAYSGIGISEDPGFEIR